MKRFLKNHAVSLSITSTVALLVSCASMSSPSGGDYDLDPPKVMHISPSFNATNVNKGKVEIVFDENVVIERPNEKVIITPPQTTMPVIRSINKKITVELRDSLLPNTTYTIDFTDAVSDNNEKNIIEDFSYSFSTGDVVDTLAISGRVVTADNIEPVTGIYVGLHSNLNDTAFTKTKFERISKTNEKGFFTIRGVAPGSYRIYALEDVSRTYVYNNMNANVAYLNTIIEPSFTPDTHKDTIFTVKNGEKTIDSIVDVKFTRFLPDDIVLRTFVSDFKRHYLQKHERQENRIMMYFGSPTPMPELEAYSFDANKDWYVLEKTAKNDTLTFWIKDPQILAIDTLKFGVTYLHTDTLNQDQFVTDTLSFFDRTRRKKDNNKKKKKEDEEEEIIFLDLKHNLKSVMDVYENIRLEFAEPIKDSLRNKIRLQRLVDTLYTEIDQFEIEQDSLNPRVYNVKYKWEYGETYKFDLDSASVHSFYGLWNNKINEKFRIKKKDDYGNLLIQLSGIGESPAFVELMDKSDRPIRKIITKKGIALFRNLNAGEYYVRLVLDENNNGIWDTGNFEENRQPESVFYNDKSYTIRANWNNEETWAVDTSDSNAAKPLAITKNKPKDKESKQEQLEKKDRQKDEEKERQRKQGQQLGRGSMGGNTDPYNDRGY